MFKQENASTPTSSAEASVSGTEYVRHSSRVVNKIENSQQCLVCNTQTRNKNKTLFLCSEISAAEQIFYTAPNKQDDVYTKIITCQEPADLFTTEVMYH